MILGFVLVSGYEVAYLTFCICALDLKYDIFSPINKPELLLCQSEYFCLCISVTCPRVKTWISSSIFFLRYNF